MLDDTHRLSNAQPVASGSEIISFNSIPGAELISKLQDYENGETVRQRQEIVLSRFGLMPRSIYAQVKTSSPVLLEKAGITHFQTIDKFSLDNANLVL